MEDNNPIQPQENKTMKLRIGRMMALAILVLLVAGLGVGYVYKDKITSLFGSRSITGYAALVDDEPITQVELDNEYAALGQSAYSVTKEQLLDELIAQKLLMNKIKESGMEIKDDEINNYLEEQRKRLNLSEKDLVELSGAKSLKDLKEQVHEQLLAAKFLNQTILKDITVTEQDAKEYYDNNTEQFVLPEQVGVKHILVTREGRTEEEVDAILQNALNDLNAGISIDNVAKKYSDDEMTKDKGGDLGYLYKGQTVPEFERVAFAMPLDQHSKTFKTQFGWHILEVYDKKPSTKLVFEDIKVKLVNLLLGQKQKEAFMAYLKTLREEADVEVFANEKPASKK